jgi:hypothetical protein
MGRLFLLLFVLFSCSCNESKVPKLKDRFTPHYIGIDSRAKPIVYDYVKLAQSHDIKLTKPVTVGFTNIKAGQVIGVCYRNWGRSIREIDLDTGWWNENSKASRKMLLFHELTHCLCNRPHDYADGTPYESIPIEDTVAWISRWTRKLPFYAALPGRYADGCPLSIMYPRIPSTFCIEHHQREYLDEMFNRCDP